MGNSLRLPCVCYDANDDEAAAATARAGRSRKKKTACRNGTRAAARHVVPVDIPETLGDGEKEEIEAAWPAGCRVEPVVGDDGGVRVKIVMKRKEVKALVARLEQRDAAERKARMKELNNELGGSSGVAVTMMRPRRESWRPCLASVPEN